MGTKPEAKTEKIVDRYTFNAEQSPVGEMYPHLDITGAEDVHIQIKEDGKVVWVNAPNCVLRICSIRGMVEVDDMRPKKWHRR